MTNAADAKTPEVGAASPLAAIFPGKTIALSSGKTVTIRKWSAKEIVHEVPAILGRVIGTLKLMAIGADQSEMAGILMTSAAPEILSLVAFTTRLPKNEVEDLPADEFVMLVREVVETNENFFGELIRLVQTVSTRALPGT